MATLDRYFLDRLGHVLDRYHQETIGDLNRAAGIAGFALNLGREGSKLFVHDRLVQWLVSAFTEDVRKKI